MAFGQRTPKQNAAIAEAYQDKEKLLKTGATPPIKPPKISATLPGQRRISATPKPRLASVPEAPQFGHKRLFYGES